MKPHRISIKLTSSDLSDDIRIKDAINNLFKFPSVVRVCVRRLKIDWMFPIEYQLTIWYILCEEWTPEMIFAQTYWGIRTPIEIEKTQEVLP
jgi:hypothetical protein